MQQRRVKAILSKLDALPTLDSIGVRLLELTSSEDTGARDVIELISADPALSGRVLKLCQRHEQGRAAKVNTVDRAVVLLGLDAVRCATLAVQVFRTLHGMHSAGGEKRAAETIFAPAMYWRHSIAVAVMSEWLASAVPQRHSVKPGEAFIAGLLHDLGQLALHVILPQSFDRACTLAESHGVSIDRAARTIIGLDTHTAGRRVAQLWRLPNELAETIWLAGTPIDALPQTIDQSMIVLVTLADALVRRQHICPIGHGGADVPIEALAETMKIRQEKLDEFSAQLHAEVAARSAAIGLENKTGDTLLLRSIARANVSLGSINEANRKRHTETQHQTKLLDAIEQFCAEQLHDFDDTLRRIAHSANAVLDGHLCGLLVGGQDDSQWRFCTLEAGGEIAEEPISEPLNLNQFASGQHHTAPETVVARLGDVQREQTPHLCVIDDRRPLRLALIHTAGTEGMGACEQLRPIFGVWSAAIAAAQKINESDSLAEQLASANRELGEAREEAARARALTAIGEVAAGAAHEMNNPLAIISGRAQMLATRLDGPELKSAADLIEQQSHLLSEQISALRSFACPIEPQPCTVNITELLDTAVTQASATTGVAITPAVAVTENDGWVEADSSQVVDVFVELLSNAIQCEHSAGISINTQIDPSDDRLRITVADTGPGLSPRALAHAFAPYFSERPAGRRAGLGLALARRTIEANRGRLTIGNRPEGGAMATVWLPRPQPARQSRRGAA